MDSVEDQGNIRREISRRVVLGIGAAVGATVVLADLARPSTAFALGSGTTWYVAKTGSDAAAGTTTAPFLTIRKAADVAQPGDNIIVRSGVYREEIVLPRGGTSDTSRITYQSETGAAVTITGSDLFTSWTQVSGDVWQLRIANSYFNGFNPYAERVWGDWFNGQGRVHRRGMVYLNGAWLPEATSLDAVSSSGSASWWSQVDGLSEVVTNSGTSGQDWPSYRSTYDPNGFTTITAKFPGVNPNNAGKVEVGIRATVFRPAQAKYDYVTIRGFKLTNAATNWGAPTMGQGQSGAVNAYWCKGWVIEGNEIGYSRCCGIALGKYSDQFDSRRGTTAGYYDTINDALWTGSDGSEAGKWSVANIGGHVVRNNTIHHCGQTGIVGSLGAIGSTIIGNEIYQIQSQGIWSGWEMAGIKIHAAIDVRIAQNHIYNCGNAGGIWLDWMAQGTQVLGNLMHHNDRDMYVEVNHGPHLYANNLFLSAFAFFTNSDGQSWAHNLVAGRIQAATDSRVTPVFAPHQTWQLDANGRPKDVKTISVASNPVGGQQWFNNVLGRPVNLTPWDGSGALAPVSMKANVYTAGSTKSVREQGGVDAASVDYFPVLFKDTDGWYLTVPRVESWRSTQALVTSDSFANAPRPNQRFTNPDDSAVSIDKDFLGVARSSTPFPGPFETAGGAGRIKVWPLPGDNRPMVPTTDAWGLPITQEPSGPTAASDVNGNINVDLRGTDGQVFQRAFVNGAWSGWAGLGGPTSGRIVGSPGLALRSGRTDVFARGLDDQLWQRTWTAAGGWTAWTALGGVLTSSPAAATDVNGNLNVHVRGTDGQVYYRAYVNGAWGVWTGAGGPTSGKIAGTPAVVLKPGRTDVFARGLDDQLWQKTWTAAGWSSWTALGGVLTSSPAAAMDVDGNINVHVRGTDGQVWFRAFVNGTWNPWAAAGGPTSGKIAGAPAVAVKPGRTDVFARGLDDQLWQRTWATNAGWSSWTALGGTFG